MVVFCFDGDVGGVESESFALLGDLLFTLAVGCNCDVSLDGVGVVNSGYCDVDTFFCFILIDIGRFGRNFGDWVLQLRLQTNTSSNFSEDVDDVVVSSVESTGMHAVQQMTVICGVICSSAVVFSSARAWNGSGALRELQQHVNVVVQGKVL